MKRTLFIGLTLAIASTAPLGAQATRGSVSKNGQSYEVRIAKPKAEVFGAALGVLTDYQFDVTQSSQDGGIIKTDWRDPKQVDQERNLVKFLFASGDPVRLNIVFVPIGTDSTRVVVRGDQRLPQINSVMKLDSDTGKEWTLLTHVADAIAIAADSTPK